MYQMPVTQPLRTAEIQNVEQTVESETDSVKGKQIAARKGITRPPLNFLSILKKAGITIDTSSPDKLCDQLYAGVFLRPDKLKYFVDKGSNKNCFVLFAKQLNLKLSDRKDKYWTWIKDKDTRGEEIEVAWLKETSWLEISGEIETVDLSPLTLYEIVLIIKVEDPNKWDFPLRFVIVTPSKKWVKRYEILKERPSNEWFEILVGEFKTSRGDVGCMQLRVDDYASVAKCGLGVHCAIIRPSK